MRLFRPTPDDPALFTKPRLLLVAAIMLVLVGIAAVIVVPTFDTYNGLPGPVINFWWSRVAPESYAVHTLRALEHFAVVDSSFVCTHPEDPYQAWETVLLDPGGEDLFLQLLTSGAGGGRVYALLGLSALGSPKLAAGIEAAMLDTASVLFTPDFTRYSLSAVPLSDLVHPDSLGAWANRIRATARNKCGG